jgi:biopolymer transport protein ExbB
MKRQIASPLLALVLLVAAMSHVARVAWAAPIQKDAAPPKETLWSLIVKGGIVMIPLGICSIIGLAMAVERSLSLRKEKIIPPQFVENTFKAWRESGPQEAIAYCEKVGGHAGNIFRAAIQSRGRGEEGVEKAIEDAGFREAEKLKRSLRGLSVIASLSPLLGLLGTVYGMISAFQVASAVGMGKAEVLAKGIYEALVTTAAGLTIAIPVLLVQQWLNSRADAIVDDLDDMTMRFMLSWTGERKDVAVKVAPPVKAKTGDAA